MSIPVRCPRCGTAFSSALGLAAHLERCTAVGGSVQLEINGLRARVREMEIDALRQDGRIHRLEGALRDVLAPALRAATILEEA